MSNSYHINAFNDLLKPAVELDAVIHTKFSSLPDDLKQKIIRQSRIAAQFLHNNDLALLWVEHRIDLISKLRNITAFTPEAERERIAITYQISGLDSFIEFCQELQHHGDKLESGPTTKPKQSVNVSGTKPVFNNTIPSTNNTGQEAKG